MLILIVQALCMAGMALVGALIARGWPRQAEKPSFWVHGQEKSEEEVQADAFAEDLAALLKYTGEHEEEQDETE